jgi:lipoprotein-anchoring transpeptidase ErfK/SrfK
LASILSQLPINLENACLEIVERFSSNITDPWLIVDSSTQQLYLINGKSQSHKFQISTSKYGLGCQQDSLMTPTGAHQIAQKIGGDNKANEIFVGRVATGEKAEILGEKKTSDKDLILTRILWLQGLEKNKNCGEGVDSFQRYIYIHGTHEEGLLGSPASHGCVRMSNTDIIDLYQKVSVGTFVYIV